VRVAAELWMREHGQTEPLDMALELEVTFWIDRPRSITVEQRPRPVVVPDLDKLVRTMDSLTAAGLILDDARIVTVRATKEYADAERAGARIRLFSA
jgi:Holliday junction resolvase RusA-like endonuclease